MRTLGRRLTLPSVPEQVQDETAWAIYLPRRRTRWLYRILAVLIGAAAGFAYGRLVLENVSPLWLVALAAFGAVLGYVLVLMPAAVVANSRRMAASLAVRRRERRLQRSVDRAIASAGETVEEREDDQAAWERLGIAALLDGESRRAADALERACALSPNGRCQVNRAVALAEAAEIDTAAEVMLQGARAPEAASAAQHNLGVLLSRYPRESLVDRVLDSLSVVEAPSVLSNLGILELERGNLDLAERYLTRAVKEDPSAVAAHANLALVSYRRGRIKEAVEQLHEAAYLDPMNPTIANDFGAMLAAAGRPLIAARVLSRAALLAPASPEVELNRGCIRLHLGQYSDALESLTDPVVRERYPALAAHNAALALIALNRLEAAREEIRWGLERAPYDADLLNNLGCLAWVEGDDAEMISILSSVDDPTQLGAQLNLVAARIGSGKTDQAMEILASLREQGVRDPLVSFYRGLALLAKSTEQYQHRMTRRQREEFFESLHRCVRPFNAVASSDGGGSIEAQVNLALYSYLRQNFAEAADRFVAATRAFPEVGFLHFCAGTALAEEARRVQAEHEEEGALVGKARELLRRARRHLEQAVEAGEVTADVFCNLGMCAYDLGDIEGALNAFKRMVQLEDSADSNNNMAIVHARQGQELQHNARAASLISRDRESDMLSRAQTHLSSALHYFLQALEHDRNDPVLHGNIGLAHMLRNRGDDVEAALRHWQRMLALGGAEAGRRFEELTALASDETRRAEFDQTLMEFRSLDPRRCMVTVPPQLAGVRQALLPIYESMDWQFVSDDPVVSDLLRQRERLAGLKQRLARLSV